MVSRQVGLQDRATAFSTCQGALMGGSNTVELVPRAALLIESLRDIGYSLDTALADIIDNSLTARARMIDIVTRVTPEERWIAIIDDGRGMSRAELLEAMRPGSRSPLEQRAPGDLGRFGLGLKTASFSQCRRLTVYTRQDGITSIARWDLDQVAASDRWIVNLLPDHEPLPMANRVGREGTLVLWEKLDRLPQAAGTVVAQDETNRRLAGAIEHLSLVFHRHISSAREGVRITFNGRRLEPLDPFQIGNPLIIADPKETILIDGHQVEIQACTLPGSGRVTPQEWERQGGREGHLRSQGFYVYRERRLIIHGTWFGLARQVDATKLTRVRVDIPTALDALWRIDVRKANADLPQEARERLRQLIGRVVRHSKRIIAEEPVALSERSRMPVWVRSQVGERISYRVNLEHALFHSFTESLGSDQRRQFAQLVEFAGASLPVMAIRADAEPTPHALAEPVVSDETLLALAARMVASLTNLGFGQADVQAIMREDAVFHARWDRIAPVIWHGGERNYSNE